MEATEFQHSGLRNHTTFNPKVKNNQSLEVFKLLVEQEIQGIKPEPIRCKKDIKKGLEELEKRKPIVIRSVDKREGLVILRKEDYERELDRLISDQDTYKLLTRDSGNKYKVRLKKLIKQAQKENILAKGKLGT